MIEFQVDNENQTTDFVVDADEITIGRSSSVSENHIHIKDPAVSRKQATVRLQNDRIRIHNHGGLIRFGNGTQLATDESVGLFLPVQIQIGNSQITISAVSDDPRVVVNTVLNWVDKIKSNDQQASADLWDKYFRRLIAFTRKKLANLPKRTSDEEDIVVDAFDSFFRGVRAGKFIDLNDHDDLWRVLAMLTARKVSREIGYRLALKRGAGQIRGESVFISSQNSVAPGIQNVSRELLAAPDILLEMQDNIGQMLDVLTEEQQEICRLKLEGYTNSEIAEKLEVNERTIERRLQVIRAEWHTLLESE